MKINFFSLLFKKKDKKNNLHIPDTILIKKLKSVCEKNNCKILENTTLFHHSSQIDIPLMAIDPKRGIYIFEYKDWTYSDLANYEIKKSHNNKQSKNTLAFEKTNNFINTKFNEILHNDFVDIFNYLLAENLTFEDYEHLDEEKKSLLPYDKVIFCDNDEDNIRKKLENSRDINNNLPDIDFIMANLLTQYLILDKKDIHFATDEQRAFIDDLSNNNHIIALNGLASSGKTTTLILKAIYLQLLSSQNSVCIIEPTKLSCDIVKQSIIELIEYSIINVDATSINVLTPEEFLNAKTTTYVFCDDASLIDESLVEQIISKCSKAKLSLVNPADTYEHFYKLTKSFHNKIDIEFIQKHPYAAAMQYINYYSNENSKTILCVASIETGKKLSEDLSSYIKEEAVLLDSSKKLIDQKKSFLTLSDYKNVSAQRSEIVILLDVCDVSQSELSYAINLANEKVFLIYEDECPSITTLKKIFNKE
ncbi:hypothetical protein FJR48_08905 [Sulfurimonas lithotrophica]|uniref:Uncharacterized protein n=1 Tax=Sulfurimonas lithotrophica TaxID=2590022 RepID=A0A5P8P278_9BACT|nr:hypothetical protein [Sulfurimonas lithotrophica]QFR49838.1 hypothetical protein FJR48_08905 [Sulfurimonas lithotrophica]